MASARQTVISGSRSVGQIKQDPAKQHHHFKSKFKLRKSRVVSVLLYGWETWTLLVDWQKDPVFPDYNPEKTSKHLLLGAQENQRLVAGQDQDACGHAGFSRHGNCSETEIGMIPAYHASRQLFQTILRSTLWRMGNEAVGRENAGQTITKSGRPCPLWPTAEEKKVEGDLCGSVHYVPRSSRSVEDLTWLDLITGAEYQGF